MTYTCTVCKATRTEPIPALPVTPEITPTDEEADNAEINKKIKKPVGIRTVSNKKKRRLHIYFKPVKGAQNYRIMYRKAGEKKWKYGWTGGKTEYTIKKLKNNGLYEFRFSAYKKNAYGKWERGAYSKTSRRYYYKAELKSVKAESGALNVSWRRNKTAGYYTLEYADNYKMKKSKRVKIPGNKITSYKIEGLKKGKKYYVRVRAIKEKAGRKYIGEFSKRKGVKVK